MQPIILRMHVHSSRIFLSFVFAGTLAATLVYAQQPPASGSLSVTTKELPNAKLWEQYHYDMQASGGIEPYRWRVPAGSLPRGFILNAHGELAGTFDEIGNLALLVEVSDSSRPTRQAKQEIEVSTEIPLTTDWDRKAQVNGQRIDGSVKVSNQTGRDFDLTFVVLAVNNIGRATAIGYQHFPLKKDTRDMELPFGDTLSPGDYVVNIDVVGEEPVSNHIFRSRLVSERESIMQEP